MRLILASASPRRKEILERAGITFTVMPADIDEKLVKNVKDQDTYVKRIAFNKGYSIWEKVANDKNINDPLVVLSADTVVCYRTNLFGKPKDRENARQILLSLAGRTHVVKTGFCIFSHVRNSDHVVSTRVQMRTLTLAEVERYLDSGEYEGKAGAYAIQGPYGQTIVDKVSGSYPNVIGLPLQEVLIALRNIDRDFLK
jgi:septum formation protein